MPATQQALRQICSPLTGLKEGSFAIVLAFAGNSKAAHHAQHARSALDVGDPSGRLSRARAVLVSKRL
jgi:hypothetical protein